MDSIKRGKFELRKANLADKDLLYFWANDPMTRSNAFNSDAIPYEAHERWFSNTILREDRIQLILEKAGTPVGQIRLDIKDNIGEVDYSIAPKYRGQGYGVLICDMLINYVKKYLSIDKITARVKTENIASKRCFIKNGFQTVYEQFEIKINGEN